MEETAHGSIPGPLVRDLPMAKPALMILGTLIAWSWASARDRRHPGHGLDDPADLEDGGGAAFILLVSIYATSKFGGSLTAILFNIPGDNPNAVTLIDGFPMAKNGKARTAIAASATVSILGGLFSSLSLLAFMP